MKTQPLLYQILLKDDLIAVQKLMLDAIQDLPQVARETVTTLIRQGGKQLRPALVLLSCRICEVEQSRALPVAAAVELLHTATLIHDDLIDRADMRRGAETLNARQFPAVAVLSGDLIFAWAARLASRGQNHRLTERFAETLVTICKGELDQMFKRNLRLTLEEYEAHIYAKTASLFSLATETGALINERAGYQAQYARQFGKLLGEAFQINDDVLDIAGDAVTLGKPVGSDLQQGIFTLPVLYYLEEHSDDATLSEQIRTVATGAADAVSREIALRDLLDAVRSSTAIERALAQAETRIATALELLATRPPSPCRDAMEEIARFAVQRRY
ncbi:MAG: polyprenyl synthetase family protein [Anaerolineae bacterium]|nr:polyprenyl synthetase family protein [Anaerolineae bacterium]